jgi:hypothetical protein
MPETLTGLTKRPNRGEEVGRCIMDSQKRVGKRAEHLQVVERTDGPYSIIKPLNHPCPQVLSLRLLNYYNCGKV